MECALFLKDRGFLSLKEPVDAESVSLRDSPLTEFAELNLNGSFNRQLQPLYQAMAKRAKVTLFDDYFMLQQHLHSTDSATITSEIVRHYRNDGGNRILIPIYAPEAQISFYVVYLAKNKNRLEKLLKWIEVCQRELVFI